MANQTKTLALAKSQLLPATPEVGGSTEQLMSDLKTTHAPNPTTVPHIWRYNELHPHLLRAGNLISERQAERRVLGESSSSTDARYTTDTLYAGLQLVMPNETAPAHRHVAFAMRFIIEAEEGSTAVHGRRIEMRRGDIILTPTMNWHDHGKDVSVLMI